MNVETLIFLPAMIRTACATAFDVPGDRGVFAHFVEVGCDKQKKWCGVFDAIDEACVIAERRLLESAA